MQPYRSVSAQTLHYLSRPHVGIPQGPVHGASAWKGKQIADTGLWSYRLNDAQIAELKELPLVVKRTGKPLGKIEPGDCPLPRLRAAIAAWRMEIEEGRGFVVVRGVPVDALTPTESEVVFWCLGLHLGIPGAQNSTGDLLTHVTNEGKGDTDASRLYKTNARIAYHCDAADVVGLLCLKSATNGGRSRIASSVAVYNEFFRQYPEDAKLLFSPVCVDARGENGLDYFRIPPFRFDGQQLRTFYHSDYFRSAKRYEGARAEVEKYEKALDRYEAIADSPEYYLEMDLTPGDIQLLSNHTVIHARTAYTDVGGAGGKRHLLRLWISTNATLPLKQQLLRMLSRATLLKELISAKIRARQINSRKKG